MNRQAGFTLVEVVVSLIVFSLVIVGLSGVFIAGGKLILHNRERMVSAQLGKFFLDPLQAYVRQNTWNQAGNELMIGVRAGAAQNINNRSFSEVHIVTAVPSTDLRRVITIISWTEAS